MGYTKSALSGVSWHFFFKVVATGLTAVKLFLLGRLLGPYAFGLFSLTTIALGLMESATETGINVILVTSNKPVTHFLNTAWVISIVRGFAIGACMIILGFFMSGFYDELALRLLITTAALIPIIRGFINPAIVSYYKKLNFIADSLYRISLVGVETLVAVGVAVLTHSVYAFVFSLIASAIFEVVLSHLVITEKPKFVFETPVAKEIFSHSKGLTVISALDYLHENVDNLIIGKQFSTPILGFYANAYGVGHKVTYELAQSVYHSTIPIFSKFVEDEQRFVRAVYRTLSSSLLSISVFAIPFIVYPRVIVWLLGAQWEASVLLVLPLVLAGLVQSTALLSYSVLITRKQYSLITLHKAASVLVLVASLAWFAPRVSIVELCWIVLWGRVACSPITVVSLVKELHFKKVYEA